MPGPELGFAFPESITKPPFRGLSNIAGYFQPIYTKHNLSIAGFEALARLHHSDRTFMPGDFMPRIQTHEWPIFDLHMLDRTCAFIADTKGRFDALPDNFFVSVNLSPETLAYEELSERAGDILDHHGVKPAHIKFEVLEQAFREDGVNTILSQLEQLKNAGHKIVLDDFYTRDSDFHRLAFLSLYISGVKVDKSFLEYSAELQKKILDDIHRISARSIPSVEITLEGVETQQDLDTLKAADCDLVQGFGLSRPVPAHAALDLLAAPVHRTVFESASQ